jgi:hypothetical protein
MIRNKILKQYKVELGKIISGKKFNGENVYVPYFWNLHQEFGADDIDNGQLIFFVTDEDRKIFPELKKVESVILTVERRGRFFHVTEVF